MIGWNNCDSLSIFCLHIIFKTSPIQHSITFYVYCLFSSHTDFNKNKFTYVNKTNRIHTVYLASLHYCYLHISFKQSHGVNKDRTVGVSICICSELEKVLLMVLPQVAFKCLPNQGFLCCTYQHEEPVIAAPVAEEMIQKWPYEDNHTSIYVPKDPPAVKMSSLQEELPLWNIWYFRLHHLNCKPAFFFTRSLSASLTSRYFFWLL